MIKSVEQISRLADNALALSLWQKSMHNASLHQLQLIAGTTNYRARLGTCKILVITAPTTGSHSHWLLVSTQRPMLFLAASTPHMTMEYLAHPRLLGNRKNIPLLARGKKYPSAPRLQLNSRRTYSRGMHRSIYQVRCDSICRKLVLRKALWINVMVDSVAWGTQTESHDRRHPCWWYHIWPRCKCYSWKFNSPLALVELHYR